MFDATKSFSARIWLRGAIKDIWDEFRIDWYHVQWTDLTKPLYSGLAARLYIVYQSTGVFKSSIPRAIPQQANFWKTYFRKTGDKNNFIKLAKLLEKGNLFILFKY